jgi:AP endonuclease-1
MHPGSTLGTDKPKAIAQIANAINEAHKKTSFVKIVLENMTGQEKIVGSRLEDLRDIIRLVENKDRVGVCIDTCHSFTAGYDLRTEKTFETFWKHFDEVIGYEYLLGIHLNDSKYPLDSKRDVHQNIGLGFLGLESFRLLMNKPELAGVPLILETPMSEDSDGAKRTREEDIAVLNWLIGRDADDPEVLTKSKELQKMGEKERQACQAQVDKKTSKKAKPVSGNRTISFKRKRAKEEHDDVKSDDD